MNITSYLTQEMGGRKFKDEEEYENTVNAILDDMESEIGKVGRWALSDPGAPEELGVIIERKLK